ncbi:MAG: hypothetical protein L0Y44_14130 [Phycisphaerales bacterium]|nr:hypothetical protein [Phycisphaerales bacterium]MCI0631780.1 hypothetical protein [Phycisphaerales bacterium]MCI0677245.1 hypothetical protein [Phycisphaerales bacterium]
MTVDSTNENEPAPGSISWPNVHPDFDGHKEWPIERMTPEQRQRWEHEMKLLHEWARRVRIESGFALPEDLLHVYDVPFPTDEA